MFCPVCDAQIHGPSNLLWGAARTSCSQCGAVLGATRSKVNTVLYTCGNCRALLAVSPSELDILTACAKCHTPFMPATRKTLEKRKHDAEMAKKTVEDTQNRRRASLFSEGQVIHVALDEVIVCSNGHRYPLRDFMILDKELRDARDYEPIYNRQGEYVRDEVVAYNYEEVHKRIGCPLCKSTLAQFESASLRGLKHCGTCDNWYKGVFGRCPLCHPYSAAHLLFPTTRDDVALKRMDIIEESIASVDAEMG